MLNNYLQLFSRTQVFKVNSVCLVSSIADLKCYEMRLVYVPIRNSEEKIRPRRDYLCNGSCISYRTNFNLIFLAN